MDVQVSLIALAGRNVESLADPETLTSAVSMVGSMMNRSGVTHVVAASPAAERLVGAVATIYATHARQAAAMTEMDLVGQSVVVVDVNLTSGTSMASTVRWARECGAAQVDGAVLHATRHSVGASECGLDDLKILSQSGF